MKVHSMSMRATKNDPLRWTRQVCEVCTVAVWNEGKRRREQSSYLSFKRFTAWSSTTEHS